MKRFIFLLMAGLMALGFGACSDEVNVPQDSNEEIADAVYMSFDLKLPSSRSATDSEGSTNSNGNPDFEVGLDKENKVSGVKVVLATATTSNGVTTYTYVAESKDGFSLVGDKDTYTVTFQAADLTSILPKGEQAGPQVYAFVVCNPPTSFDATQIFTGNGSVATDDETLEKSIAQGNSFLMTNAEISKVSTIPSDLTSYNSPSNPFDLGVVEVERTAARFDYKAGGTNGDNIYPVKDTKVSIKLTGMTLVNMSKNYWWLRRVADASKTITGQYDPTTINLCGVETPENYVVDTDHEAKLTEEGAPAANFIYHVGMSGTINPTSFAYTDINSLTENDNWTGAEGYYVWRYATENTLPSIDGQIKKYSTGVIFKGVIEESGAEETEKLLDGSSNVYVFGDVLYGNWTKVKAAAEETEDGGDLKNVSLNAAYNQAQATVNGEGVTEPTKGEAVKAGFTVYSPNEDGAYEVYYYYWNRHNDNVNSTQMGIMEFAVVRNNVYKLSVTEINRYGHPGDPTGDPDPEDPDDPDEDDEVYFRVGVKVLPWVVRVNDIEF